MINTEDMEETLAMNGMVEMLKQILNTIENMNERLIELENLMNDNLVDVEMKADCNARDIVKLNKKLTDYIPKTERFI